MNYKHIAVCCAGTALAFGLVGTAIAEEDSACVGRVGAGRVGADRACAGCVCVGSDCADRGCTVKPTCAATVEVSASDIVKVGQALHQAAEAKRQLTAGDESWLQVLRRYWGRDSITVPDLDKLPATRQVDCRLSVDYINAHPQALVALDAAWTAMDAATKELKNLQFFQGEGYVIPVHNREIKPLLRNEYNQTSFDKLFTLVREKGAFDIKVNPKTGLVTTSDIAGHENAEMALRQWVTDTVRTGQIEKLHSPKSWTHVLNTLAKYYTSATEQKTFDRCIADPNAYREGGLDVGVAHIFYPNTLQRDPNWFNNKRLESHGLALLALCEGIEGCADKQPWAAYEVSDAYMQAIANLAAYLMRIDYYSAPSAGNWEETPFPGGLTWDSMVISNALQHLDNLLRDKKYDNCPQVVQLRKRLGKLKHGEYAADHEMLETSIGAGRERVRVTYMAESPGTREIDASLSFMSAMPTLLDDDPLSSAAKYLSQLEMLERNLVRDNGMLRYAPFFTKLKDGSKMQSPDSYLTLNYNIACDPQGKLNLEWKGVLDSFGSKDCSEPQVFAARAGLATPNREAEWFMVSDLATGYARQAMNAINSAAKRLGCSPNNITLDQLNTREKAIFYTAKQGATRNINRAYARITDSVPSVKANGQMAGAWKVPEAWQSVSTLDGRVAYLPGVNTPLTWAAVSLWNASNEYLELLKY